MTSEENNEETISFFEENNFFGYNKSYIKFFIQGKMPLLSVDGKLLIDENKRIKQAADGHGGIFKAMEKNGIIEDLEKNNIEWIFTCAIDNILVKMVDPLLVGIAIDEKTEVAVKTLIKVNAKEKIGVMCNQDGINKVIEYTELPQDMAELTDECGELVYGEANVMFNLFNISAIKKAAKQLMPYHIAFKKNSYVDENGKLIVPDEPNSYKFESLIFDSFELFDKIALIRGIREEEFAPIKNKTGVDSVETATELYNNYWKKF